MDPDIVILAAEWRTRALLRAQLIEEGLHVVATDTWPLMQSYFHGVKPRLAIVDLQNLTDFENVLAEIREVFAPNRVLVLRALGAPDQAQLESVGFHVIERPVTIRDIVLTARNLLTSG
jgi:DNA-binding response OmpR family regulator